MNKFYEMNLGSVLKVAISVDLADCLKLRKDTKVNSQAYSASLKFAIPFEHKAFDNGIFSIQMTFAKMPV